MQQTIISEHCKMSVEMTNMVREKAKASAIKFQLDQVLELGMVMGHGPSGSHSPTKPLNFLVQNCIRLEPSPFRARPLDFLIQNLRPFTTPSKDEGLSTDEHLS